MSGTEKALSATVQEQVASPAPRPADGPSSAGPTPGLPMQSSLPSLASKDRRPHNTLRWGGQRWEPRAPPGEHPLRGFLRCW